MAQQNPIVHSPYEIDRMTKVIHSLLKFPEVYNHVHRIVDFLLTLPDTDDIQISPVTLESVKSRRHPDAIAADWIHLNHPTPHETPKKYYRKYVRNKGGKRRLDFQNFNEVLSVWGYQKARLNGNEYWTHINVSDSDSDKDNNGSSDDEPLVYGIVYLVQSKSMKDDHAKIGMSSGYGRLKAYWSGRKEHRCIRVLNPVECERSLKKAFRKKFGHPEQGREYFKGDVTRMMEVFDSTITKHKVRHPLPNSDIDTDSAFDSD